MDKGKIIAVWGSPNSGKTTFATKLATAIYDSYQATVIVLYTDLEAPVLPVLFPNSKPEDIGSVGIPLSKTEIDRDEVIKQLVTNNKRQNFGFLGYRAGENKLTYPKFGRAKAEALFEVLCELADYVVVDCTSNLENNVLASVGMELASQVIRLASPDLKSISYYISQLSLYGDVKYKLDEHIQGINTPNADVFMPIEEAKAHLSEVAFSLPFCVEVKEQMQKGTVHESVRDKLYSKRMREIAKEVVDYGTH